MSKKPKVSDIRRAMRSTPTPAAPKVESVVYELTASQTELVRSIVEFRQAETARIEAVAQQKWSAILKDLQLPLDTKGTVEEVDGKVRFVVPKVAG